MTATNYGVLGQLEVPLGLGLLRLSTEGRPAESDAIDVIHFALDQGIRVLDTADSYALDDRDMHYGERLVRKAIAAWEGPREQVRVITKAGLARPKGRWVPNARPDHLRKMVEGSLTALGVERIFLLLLHANDPKTPYEDSLGALAQLQKEGKIEHLGLSNTSIAEVRQAERHFAVCAIQNELSVIDRNSGVEGLVALARRMNIPFLAHRPLGGHAKIGNLLKNRAVKPIAARHKITPHEAALAALLDLGAPVIPLFGATKRASVESSLRALKVPFDERDRAELG
ncbi:MAG TPA: aldo/keto reductase, partial [Nannocystis sp.]